MHHFADDTNLLTISNNLRSIRKKLNLDLRFLCNWLTSNKLSLNASKTEVVLFKHPNKPINYDLNLKINGQKIIFSESVKYLGLHLDKHLNWQEHTANLKIKLSRSIGMLSKIRHYVSNNVLTNIYYAIFSSHLTYGCQIWGQNKNTHIKRIISIQSKALRIMHFKSVNSSSRPLFKKSKILTLSDVIKLKDFLFAYDHYHNKLPQSLRGIFTLVNDTHAHNTRNASNINLTLPSVNTSVYGIYSIKYQSILCWNKINSLYNEKQLASLSKNQCRNLITKHFLSNYL